MLTFGLVVGVVCDGFFVRYADSHQNNAQEMGTLTEYKERCQKRNLACPAFDSLDFGVLSKESEEAVVTTYPRSDVDVCLAWQKLHVINTYF